MTPTRRTFLTTAACAAVAPALPVVADAPVSVAEEKWWRVAFEIPAGIYHSERMTDADAAKMVRAYNQMGLHRHWIEFAPPTEQST